MISEDVKNRLDELVTVANESIEVFLSENTDTLNDIEIALDAVNNRIAETNVKVDEVNQNQEEILNLLQPFLEEKLLKLKEKTERLNKEEADLKLVAEQKDKLVENLLKEKAKLVENLAFISSVEMNDHKNSDILVGKLQETRNNLIQAEASRKSTLDDLLITVVLKSNNERKIENETQKMKQLTKENISSISLSTEEREIVKELHRNINNKHNQKELEILKKDAHSLETVKIMLSTNPDVLKEEITTMIIQGSDGKAINDKLDILVRMTEPLEEMEKNMSTEIEELTQKVTNIPFEDSADHYYDTASSSAETFERVYLEKMNPILDQREATIDQEITRRTVVLSPLVSAISDFKDVIKDFEVDRNEIEDEIATASLIGSKEKELELRQELITLNEEISSAKLELKNYEQELSTTKNDIQKSREQKNTNLNQKNINAERLDMLIGRSEYGENFRNTKKIEKDALKLNLLREKQDKIVGILNHSGSSVVDKKEDILKSINIQLPTPIDNYGFDLALTPVEEPERSKIQKWKEAPKELINKIKGCFKKYKDKIITTLKVTGLVLLSGLLLSGDAPNVVNAEEEDLEKISTVENTEVKQEADLKIGDSIVNFDGNNEAFLTAYDAINGTNATTFNTNYVNSENGSKVVAFATTDGIRTNAEGTSIKDFAETHGVSSDEIAALYGTSDTKEGYQGWVPADMIENDKGRGK